MFVICDQRGSFLCVCLWFCGHLLSSILGRITKILVNMLSLTSSWTTAPPRTDRTRTCAPLCEHDGTVHRAGTAAPESDGTAARQPRSRTAREQTAASPVAVYNRTDRRWPHICGFPPCDADRFRSWTAPAPGPWTSVSSSCAAWVREAADRGRTWIGIVGRSVFVRICEQIIARCDIFFSDITWTNN